MEFSGRHAVVEVRKFGDSVIAVTNTDFDASKLAAALNELYHDEEDINFLVVELREGVNINLSVVHYA